MPISLTKEHLESLIAKKEFIRHGETLTICVLTLHSGFQLLGQSACIDPANFDAAIGEKIAYDNAVEKMWELEGYRVKHDIGGDFLYRLRNERTQLNDRLGKLTGFIANGQPGFIDDAEWARLGEQKQAMVAYLAVLDARIKAAEERDG